MNRPLGGKEERTLKGGETRNEDPIQNDKRSINHTFVTTFRRNRDAIRQEVVESAKNFLQVSFKRAKSVSLIDFLNINSIKTRLIQVS